MMLPGKIPPEVLKRIIFSNLGTKDDDILLGPGIGQDASVIRVGDSVIIASTDPITGSIEDIGWLAVHVNANDIATFGVEPRWFLTSIMLPAGTLESELERIMNQIHEAAEPLGISVAGGHTEITEKLQNPIIAGFMIGVCKEGEYVTSSGAKEGDSIIMTKTAAIEGTAILAAEGYDYLQKRINESTIKSARSLRNQISVVPEGIAAMKTGYITAMHDPTEGGLSGGLHEIADASGVGFRVDFEKIPIDNASREICNILDVNFMELISSGCMLLTCNSENVNSVLEAIQAVGIEATVIGRIISDSNHRVVIDSMDERALDRPITDALWDALKKIKSP